MQFMKTAPISVYWLNRLKRLPRLPFNICRRVFYAMATFIWPCGIFKGIRTLDFSRKTRSSFDQKIYEALALIEQNDPVRFERVRREIRLIIYDRWLLEPLPAGSYFYQARACMINLKRFDFSKSPKFRTALLAATIVDGGTLGHLRRIRLLNPNRYKIICRKEEIRFLLKLGYDLRGFDVSETGQS